ncbi:MAG: TetR family transcriptional regulator [Anaerolineae bacterium]|nr:TetR family transcriptional regulator [Anaerolineae bacterium]
MVRKTKEEAELTRQAVVMAALKVFSRQGYAATRLEDIADEAGVTRGAIYWHFKNKADLYVELQYRAAERVEQVIAEAIEEGGRTIDFLRRMLIRIWSYLEEDEEFRAVQELSLLKSELTPDLQESMGQKLEAVRNQSAKLVVSFRRAMAEGDIDPRLDAEALARGYYAYLNGMVLMWVLDPSSFSIKQSAPAMADLFLRGLRP